MHHTNLTQTFDTKIIATYLLKIVAGSLFIAASAQISIPFYPVPMTLQSLALMILGLACTPSVAAGALGLYIFEAFIGLPVLSNFTGGTMHLFGTRGGYILAFLPMVVSISYISRLNHTLWNKVFACLVGNIVLYASGVTWLSHFVGFEKAIQFGLHPFLLQIPVYIVLAVLSDRALNKLNIRF